MATIRVVRGNEMYPLSRIVEDVLNVIYATVSRGHIPNERDISHPEQTGGYWYRDGDKYNVAPRLNDYKVFIREESEDGVVLELWYRYPGDRMEVLAKVLETFFKPLVTIVD